MKTAYLILAHNSPKHLRRLVKALSSGSSSLFIHVDKKSSDPDLLTVPGGNLHYISERVPVFWGDFSAVEAILVLIQNAFDDNRQFSRFVLLSGSDYPLRSASSIQRFFEGNPNTEFMNLVAMHSKAAGKSISRLTTYQLRPGSRAIFPVIRKALMKVGVLPQQRDYLSHLPEHAPYGGATWWALSRQACDYILNFVKTESKAVNFFRNTHIPDEAFFQTILGNSHFRSRIARNLTYADWSPGATHPAYLTEKHLAFFQSTSSFAPDGVYGRGEMLFARKFSDQSGDLVARLDSLIREKEQLKPPSVPN